MNRTADRIRRTHASTESSHALKGRELRSFRPFPASAGPSPLEHSLGEIALLPATGGPAPVFQANPNRAEIVPDNQVPGMTIQAKLMIGAPGDKFEQEADRVATQVVRQIQEPEPRESVREQAVHREEIQGKDHQVESRPMSVNAPSGVLTRSAPPHLEPSIHQARRGGQPLPNPIRVPMEQAFVADFSGVRIHADGGSDELARSIQAEAFTTGRDVYFRQGAYEPRSRGGQKLLAHELTHVVQQLPHGQEHLDDQSSAESIPRDLVDQDGGGQPLPEPVQRKMEAFFNTNFADVRVHVGHEAPSIGALAFTHGTDLYFSPGQYNPTSPQGQRLLGHELTHVVQQRAGRVRNPLGSGIAVVQDPALEAEAERMGLRAAISSIPLQPKLAGPTRVRTKSNPAPALIPDAAQQPLIAPRSSQRTAQATRAIMPRLLPGRSAPVIQRLKWVDAEIGKAALTPQLGNALDLAIAHPTDTHLLPDWVKTRLIVEDDKQINAKHMPISASLADEAWKKIPPQGQARLVEVTWKTAKMDQYMVMVRAGQENRVTTLQENLDGGYKWNVDFKNSDGDLPGVAGAGGYKEYYAEPSPSDPPSAGFWGQNRILRRVADGWWWSTSDHYTNYIKVII